MTSLPKDAAERDQRLNAILAECLEASRLGQQGDVAVWQARYPEFAAELGEFLAGQEQLERLTAPLREVLQPTVENGLPDAGFATLVEDLTARLQAGEAVDLEACLREHPEHAERLGPLLPALRFLAVPAGAESGRDRPTLGDFRILREIGRGGMGIVYEAEQRSLNRRVALKVLPLAATMDPQHLQRFRNEAETVALLDHPHIVPVYEVGEQAGQIYFSMKLVGGGSLAQQLGRFQADIRSAARLLAAVARAVHHAHQRGILHRDLKPANILLDAEGQAHVTDFGLARRVEIDSSLTQSGALVGTPSYMAPEQASGQKGSITTATDVYGLGAVLYALLTGKPPFRGETVLDTLEQVKGREPEPPSRSNRRVDRDLETICLKCLHKEPSRRYASALALAEDLDRFLAGEPIQARPLSRLVRLGRWGRRHKALVAAAAALLVAVLMGGATLWGRLQERAATERVVGEYLQRAELLQEQERWSEMRQVLERAEERLAQGGLDYLRQRVRRLRDEADWVAELEEARLQYDGTSDLAGTDRAYAKAFAKRGLDLTMLTPEAAAHQIRRSAIRTRLVVALDHWAFVKEERATGTGERLLAVARLMDDNPWRQQLRDSKVRQDRAALERLARAEGVLAQPPDHLWLLGKALEARKGRVAAEQLLRQAHQHHPTDFWISFELGNILGASGERRGQPERTMEGLGFYRVALALRPHSPRVYTALGSLLLALGKLPDAVAAHHKAIELRPDYAGAYNNLGNVLREQGKLTEAVAALRKAIDLEPDLAEAYSNLAIALHRQKKLPEAVEACRKAIELKPDCADAHNNLGCALREQEKLPEAITAFRESIKLEPDYPGA
jgi:serine/threonine-protein kinase